MSNTEAIVMVSIVLAEFLVILAIIPLSELYEEMTRPADPPLLGQDCNCVSTATLLSIIAVILATMALFS